MRGRVRIPILLLIWIIIGVFVAVNKGYATTSTTRRRSRPSSLAVFLWPIPALDGAVGITF